MSETYFVQQGYTASNLIYGPSGEIFTSDFNNITFNGNCKGIVIITSGNNVVTVSTSLNTSTFQLPGQVNGQLKYLLLSSYQEMSSVSNKIFTDGTNTYQFVQTLTSILASNMTSGGFLMSYLGQSIPISFFEENGWIIDDVINFNVFFVPFYTGFLNLLNVYCS